MRPIELELSAFGPYLEPQRVNFARLGEHGLFLIHGRTGSGKSSVLDALCYALFGKSTGDERKGEDFISTLDRGADTKVVLTFEHLGVKYRVTRRPSQEVAKKRGTGTTTRPTEATLENLDSGGVLATRTGEVTSAVEEMLGCNVSQFRQTVVLPQGDFRRVVTEHGARRETLAKIFGSERFARVAERLAQAAKLLAQQGKDLQEQRAKLLEEHGAENLADLESSLDAAKGVVERAASAKREAVAAKGKAVAAEAAGKALAEDFDELERERALSLELAERREEVEELKRQAARADKAAMLGGQRDELDRRREERAGLEQLVASAQVKLTAAEQELVARRDALARLEEQRPLLEKAESEFRRLTALKPYVDGLAEKLTRRQRLLTDLENTEERLRAAEGAVKASEQHRGELNAERGKLQLVAAAETEIATSARAAEDDLDRWDRLDQLNVELAELDEQIANHHDDAESLALLTESVVANAPGLLAQDLDEAEPCPVCGSIHHPSPSLHGDVEALRRAFEEFGAASAALASLKQQRATSEREAQKLRLESGWLEAVPARDELVSKVESTRAKFDEVADARKRIAELESALDELDEAHAAKVEEQKGLQGQLAGIREDLNRVEGEVSSALSGLEPEHHDTAAFAAALAAAEAESERLRTLFEGAKQGVATAERELDKAQTAHRGESGRLQTVSESLERLEEAFSAKLAVAGFGSRADFDDAFLPEEELGELQRTVRSHEAAVKLNASTIARLSRKLEGKQTPDVEALAAAVERAAEAEETADAALAEATAACDKSRDARDRFLELQSKDAELAERRRAAQKLDDLANGSLRGRAKVNFETFVLRSIFARVLVEANRHLRHMTAGRYTMLLVEDPSGRDTGLELNVRDNQGRGEVRPVHTLSGGEGFLASLSLALGLSEIAQRESGGVELGALFIDEGFGSLDTQSLDQVIDILKSLEHGHRMVGIISHVEDLKRRIPVQLLVHDGPAGSRVEMRLNA